LDSSDFDQYDITCIYKMMKTGSQKEHGVTVASTKITAAMSDVAV